MAAASSGGSSVSGYSNFREYAYMMSLLGDPSRYNLFFFAIHGEIVEGLPRVPKNTIVIQTGAGESRGCLTYTTALPTLFEYFGKKLNETFGTFVGMTAHNERTGSSLIEQLYYNVEEEQMVEKAVFLKDENLGERDFGIFQLDRGSFRKLENSNPMITELINVPKTGKKLLLSKFVTFVNGLYRDKMNIMIFLTCSELPHNMNSFSFVPAVTHHGNPLPTNATSIKYHPKVTAKIPIGGGGGGSSAAATMPKNEEHDPLGPAYNIETPVMGINTTSNFSKYFFKPPSFQELFSRIDFATLNTLTKFIDNTKKVAVASNVLNKTISQNSDKWNAAFNNMDAIFKRMDQSVISYYEAFTKAGEYIPTLDKLIDDSKPNFTNPAFIKKIGDFNWDHGLENLKVLLTETKTVLHTGYTQIQMIEYTKINDFLREIEESLVRIKEKTEEIYSFFYFDKLMNGEKDRFISSTAVRKEIITKIKECVFAVHRTLLDRLSTSLGSYHTALAEMNRLKLHMGVTKYRRRTQRNLRKTRRITRRRR